MAPVIEVDLSNPWLAIGVGVFVMLAVIVALIARHAPQAPRSSDPAVADLTVRVTRLEASQGEMEHNVRNIRTVVGNLPTKDSIAEINAGVAESKGQIAGMQVALNALTHSSGRIEDFLMKVAGDALVQRVQRRARRSYEQERDSEQA